MMTVSGEPDLPIPTPRGTRGPARPDHRRNTMNVLDMLGGLLPTQAITDCP